MNYPNLNVEKGDLGVQVRIELQININIFEKKDIVCQK